MSWNRIASFSTDTTDPRLQEFRLLQLAGDAPELLEARIGRVGERLQVVQEDERVLVHRVTMVIVELHQASHAGELGDVGGEDAHLVHLTQRLGDAAGRLEQGQEESQGSVRAPELVVDQFQAAPDGLLGVGAQLVAHLLPVPEELEESDGILPETAALCREDVDLTVQLGELVADVPGPQLLHYRLHVGARTGGAPLDEAPGKLVQRSRPGVVLLHESLDAKGGLIPEAQVGRHRDL
jgi:hypothetical protein